MPRYFFDVEDGTTSVDTEGTELTDLHEAKCEAAKLAGQMICNEPEAFWDREEWIITVSNEARLTLFTIHIVGMEAPAVAPTPKP